MLFKQALPAMQTCSNKNLAVFVGRKPPASHLSGHREPGAVSRHRRRPCLAGVRIFRPTTKIGVVGWIGVWLAWVGLGCGWVVLGCGWGGVGLGCWFGCWCGCWFGCWFVCWSMGVFVGGCSWVGACGCVGWCIDWGVGLGVGLGVVLVGWGGWLGAGRLGGHSLQVKWMYTKMSTRFEGLIPHAHTCCHAEFIQQANASTQCVA